MFQGISNIFKEIFPRNLPTSPCERSQGILHISKDLLKHSNRNQLFSQRWSKQYSTSPMNLGFLNIPDIDRCQEMWNIHKWNTKWSKQHRTIPTDCTVHLICHTESLCNKWCASGRASAWIHHLCGENTRRVSYPQITQITNRTPFTAVAEITHSVYFADVTESTCVTYLDCNTVPVAVRVRGVIILCAEKY